MPDWLFDEICKMRQLRSLTFYGAYPTNDAAYKGLEHLTNLAELEIRSCGVNRGGLDALTNLTNLMRLKSLDLDYDGPAKDTNVLGCLKGLTNLTVGFY